jgi:pre-rRNA-processing protein IPI3
MLCGGRKFESLNMPLIRTCAKHACEQGPRQDIISWRRKNKIPWKKRIMLSHSSGPRNRAEIVWIATWISSLLRNRCKSDHDLTMLTENFIAATLTANKPVAHASAALKDVGVFFHESQPRSVFRHGFKKSSSQAGCVAVSRSHIFAAQADKAVVNVYSREKGNQEAIVPFPERVHSVAYAQNAEILILGTEGGRLILWEVATGRVTNSAAAHLQAVSCLCITPRNESIISGSADSSIHIWSLARLVCFEPSSEKYGSEPSNAPLATFSNHRSAISALACGHSSISTNFAVSASIDGTCHIWHPATCQILRTLLVPSFAVSVALDPADRAVYFGCEDGRIQSWDVFQQSRTSSSHASASTTATPVQLLAKDSWKMSSTELGQANCLTTSYDGTSLLSGHVSGAIVRWDVAKHRILNEITNLGQPVTNLRILEPEGFPNQLRPHFMIPQVVKPNLEFSAMKDNGSSGIPAKYNIHAMIINSQPLASDDSFHLSLTSTGIPQAMFDEAIRSLSVEDSSHAPPTSSDVQLAMHEKLEQENLKLKQQIAALQDAEEKRLTRKLARMAQRDKIGMEKREAYFEAKKQGKDGDAAMKNWESREAQLDEESDREELRKANEMDAT